jgi:hypothetical protein
MIAPHPSPLQTESTRSVPRSVPRKGRAIPCRGAQSAAGERGAARASVAARFQPCNTAALNHGARWIMDHAADAPLPASTSPETKKRILDMRSALSEAWTATPHASTPLGGLGLAVITRLATAMVCLDADAADDFCGPSEKKRLAAIRQLSVLLSRLGREMSRWGLIWGPWATQASPALVSAEPEPVDNADDNRVPSEPEQEQPDHVITKPAEDSPSPSTPGDGKQKTGPCPAGRSPATPSTPEKEKIGRSPSTLSTSSKQKTGRSPAGRSPSGKITFQEPFPRYIAESSGNRATPALFANAFSGAP